MLWSPFKSFEVRCKHNVRRHQRTRMFLNVSSLDWILDFLYCIDKFLVRITIETSIFAHGKLILNISKRNNGSVVENTFPVVNTVYKMRKCCLRTTRDEKLNWKITSSQC